jgi:hypothetical protein
MAVHGCTRLYTIVQSWVWLYVAAEGCIRLCGCKRFYSVVQGCTLLYNVVQGCKTVVHGCAVHGCKRLYTVIQSFKRLYIVNKIVYWCKVGYGCTWLCTMLSKTVHGCLGFIVLYKVVHCFTMLYKVVKQLYTIVHSCTMFYKAVHGLQECILVYEVLHNCI